MPIVKRLHPSEPAHHATDVETVVWGLIVLLLGVSTFAILTLLRRVGG